MMSRDEWTPANIFPEFIAEGKLSRRKRAFMRLNYLTAVRNETVEFNQNLYDYLGHS